MSQTLIQRIFYLSLSLLFFFLLSFNGTEVLYRWSRQYKEYGVELFLLLLPFLLAGVGGYFFFQWKKNQKRLKELEDEFQKQDEKERILKKKEAQFRTLSESAPVGFFLTDIAGACVYANPKCLELAGVSTEEVLGDGWAKNIHPEDKERVGREWMEAFQKKAACQHEYRWLHEDGRIVETLGLAEPYYVSDELGGYVGTLIDLTQRKQAEKALARSEAQFRSLAESLPVGIFQNDAEGNCVYLNPACSELVGMSLEESYGTGWLPAVHPEDREQVMQDWAEVIANGSHLHNEARWLHKDGRIVYTLGVAVPIAEQDGEVQGYIGALFDLTERRKVELALQKSEIQFRTLTESSPVGIFQHDAEGNCIYVNPRCAEMIGTAPEDCLGMGWMQNIDQESREGLMDTWQGIIKDQGSLVHEASWIHPDGDIVYSVGQVVPMVNRAGGLEGFLGTLIDLTERKKAEKILADHRMHLETLVEERTTQLRERVAEVEQLNLRLKTANDELEGFSYSVSHDLRAPLRHINGFVGLLRKREKEKLSSDSLRFIDLSIEAVHKMNQLIDDLLVFSRTNRMEIETGEVNVSQLILDIKEEFLPETEKRQVDWQIHPLSIVKADPNLLRIVWMNLISNALKYSSPQSIARIEIGNDRSANPEEVVFFIRDNGVGFEQKYAQKIFGVFQRLHSKEEFDGTGIGLATVRRIIQRHGGRVWAQSEPGKGTSIYFSLPKKVVVNGTLDQAG